MFSKLVFTIDGEEIELELHEVVKIAYDLVSADPGQTIEMPSPSTLNIIFDDMLNLGPFAHAAKEDALDPFLFVPHHVMGMNRPREWLFVAKQFAQTPENAFPGWWLLIAGRLLLVQNTKDYRFYISDHGPLSDIIEGLQQIVMDLPWLEQHEIVSALVQNRANLVQYKTAFFNSLAQSQDEIQESHPDCSAAELQDMQEKIQNDTAYQEMQWQRLKTAIPYLIETVAKKFAQLKFQDAKDFDVEIYDLYEHDLDAADKIIKRIVLAQIMKEVNQGQHAPLFRPIHSYGDANIADAYHQFASTVENYLSQPNAMRGAELAKKVRETLIKNNDISLPDELAFIPNIIAAWFIGEGPRNSLACMDALMQLDMMENNIPLIDDDGTNLYSWKHTLVHPLNDLKKNKQPVQGSDLYGKLTSPYKIGGSFPMAFNGSKDNAKIPMQNPSKPGADNKLSMVRQKEGRLLLHWIFRHLKKAYPDFPVKLIGISVAPLPTSPRYDRIDQINKKITELRKRMAHDPNVDKQATEIAIHQLEGQIQKLTHLYENLIKPLLKLRLESWANFYLAADKNTMHRIVKIFLGENYYHFNVSPQNITLHSFPGIAEVNLQNEKITALDPHSIKRIAEILNLKINFYHSGNCNTRQEELIIKLSSNKPHWAYYLNTMNPTAAHVLDIWLDEGMFYLLEATPLGKTIQHSTPPTAAGVLNGYSQDLTVKSPAGSTMATVTSSQPLDLPKNKK